MLTKKDVADDIILSDKLILSTTYPDLSECENLCVQLLRKYEPYRTTLLYLAETSENENVSLAETCQKLLECITEIRSELNGIFKKIKAHSTLQLSAEKKRINLTKDLPAEQKTQLNDLINKVYRKDQEELFVHELREAAYTVKCNMALLLGHFDKKAHAKRIKELYGNLKSDI